MTVYVIRFVLEWTVDSSEDVPLDLALDIPSLVPSSPMHPKKAVGQTHIHIDDTAT
jgi:hypothetical protein